ncbi:DUF6160 family protein [Aquirhabdus sp.]|uniref:DUF6160 family protein n=1 Tax=Aquirhabdus sp. TaxID=2824160 RepID=UPI00396C79AD
MKLFTQLALVSAIASTSSAFAMQSMDDAALSNATGQDGITILISLPSNTLKIDQIAVFDGDGTTGALESGAIVLGKTANGAGIAAGTAPTLGTGFSIAASGPIGVVIDSSGGGASGATTGAAPILNIAVKLPATLNVTTGDIGVAGAQGAAGAYKVDANTTTGKGVVKILNSMTIGLGGASLNIQLGTPTAAQGAMIAANATLTNGLSIANIGLIDGSTNYTGTLGIGNLTLTGGGAASASDLKLIANIDFGTAANLTTQGITNADGTAVTAGGMVIGLGNATAGSAKYNAYMQGVTLGDAASTLGDVRVTGLDLTGAKVVIQGH